MHPKVIDNDQGDITVEVYGKEVRGWSYKDDAERRMKMLAAREFAEGWLSGLARMKEGLDTRLNNVLCEMKEGYDDSIVGFNEAWDVMRKAFAETAPIPSIVHVAYAEQRADIPNYCPDKCPTCGTDAESNFGLAGGGMGVYTYCPKCEKVLGKVQTE